LTFYSRLGWSRLDLANDREPSDFRLRVCTSGERMERDVYVGTPSTLLSDPAFDDFHMSVFALSSAMKSGSQSVESGGL
jgi:hypothetical protein